MTNKCVVVGCKTGQKRKEEVAFLSREDDNPRRVN